MARIRFRKTTPRDSPAAGWEPVSDTPSPVGWVCTRARELLPCPRVCRRPYFRRRFSMGARLTRPAWEVCPSAGSPSVATMPRPEAIRRTGQYRQTTRQNKPTFIYSTSFAKCFSPRVTADWYKGSAQVLWRPPWYRLIISDYPDGSISFRKQIHHQDTKAPRRTNKAKSQVRDNDHQSRTKTPWKSWKP